MFELYHHIKIIVLAGFDTPLAAFNISFMLIGHSDSVDLIFKKHGVSVTADTDDNSNIGIAQVGFGS